ncbi:MAG: hypothetical protein NVSMB57_03140 [Actinomycetota bacterium]
MSVTTPGGRTPYPSLNDGISRIIDLRSEEPDSGLQGGARVRPAFTRRQREVLSYVGDGASNAEIATLLGISKRTVEKHIEAIHMKAGTATRARLVAFVHALNAVHASAIRLDEDKQTVESD